jgi:pheromone shutdown protein TraB
MITLLGVSHVLRIAEPVTFIIKNIWPDAVLLELDERRYSILTSSAPPEDNGEADTQMVRNTAATQRKMAEEQGSQMGAEFVAAIGTAKLIGAEIVLIDVDAAKMMNEAWKEMPFTEKMRFGFGAIRDKLRPGKRAKSMQKKFAENEEEYFAWMRKKYPTLVRKIIDERNDHMAAKIKDALEKYENIVAVIGDGHVEGLAKMIGPATIRKIRLETLMDNEKMNELRAELWTGKAKEATE